MQRGRSKDLKVHPKRAGLHPAPVLVQHECQNHASFTPNQPAAGGGFENNSELLWQLGSGKRGKKTRLTGVTCQKTRRQATGRRGGSAPPRLGRAGGAGTAQPAARSCRILPACLGPSPAPVGIATTPCLQPAPASQNNLCMVSAHEDITVPLKEHCVASSLVCEVSESWPFSVEIAAALGTALTAP